MSALLQAEVDALKARVALLEAKFASGSGPSTGTPAASSGKVQVQREEPLDDHHLVNDWADKAIKKDPKKWKGESMVGRRWSQAPAEWLVLAAESAEYKAHMGRLTPDSDPKKWVTDQATGEVRLDKKTGEKKAWHEGDTFNAKLLRAWAKRNAANPPPGPGDDDFTFGANAGAEEAAKLDW